MRRLALALLVLGLASPALAQGVIPTLKINPGSCSLTPTIVTGTSGTLVSANTARKSLRWMNIGAVVITVAPGTSPPTAGTGMLYEPNSQGAGHQGGNETFNDSSVPTNAFAYSASATATIAVWECQ